MTELETGEILEIHTTDKGATNDLSAWSKTVGQIFESIRRKWCIVVLD